MNRQASILVRDEGVAGSNPATPTRLRTDTRTETPENFHPRWLFPPNFGLPEYPMGQVSGPCVCGSWPGGECLRCPIRTPTPSSERTAK
jgi:hypothetical protein